MSSSAPAPSTAFGHPKSLDELGDGVTQENAGGILRYFIMEGGCKVPCTKGGIPFAQVYGDRKVYDD
jgi:hypothetical protein